VKRNRVSNDKRKVVAKENKIKEKGKGSYTIIAGKTPVKALRDQTKP
jgi:hypothetical protein